MVDLDVMNYTKSYPFDNEYLKDLDFHVSSSAAVLSDEPVISVSPIDSLSSMKLEEDLTFANIPKDLVDTSPPEKGFLEKVGSFFSSAFTAVKDFFHNLFIQIGFMSPVTDKKIARTSLPKVKTPLPNDEILEFDEKDFANMDPLKAMLELIARHKSLKEDEAALLTKRILENQTYLTSLQKMHSEYKADVELLDKRGKIIDKVTTTFSILKFLSLVATGVSMVVSAASIVVTGGLTAPIAIALGISNTAILTGNAVTSIVESKNKHTLSGIKSGQIQNMADTDNLRVVIKMSSKDIKHALESIGQQAELAQSMIETSLGKK